MFLGKHSQETLLVIRVVKYSKDWKRLGQTSLRGANTTIPFDAGSLRCAEYGDYLYIRTCHEMYASSRDGKNHQANLTLTVRQSDMRLTDTYYIVMNNSVGYVSHSFNQFVLIDQERNIVTLDHGDAYPRSIVLMLAPRRLVCPKRFQSLEYFTTRITSVSLFWEGFS